MQPGIRGFLSTLFGVVIAVHALTAVLPAKADETETPTHDALEGVAPELLPAARQMLQMSSESPAFSAEALPKIRERRWDPRDPLADVPIEYRGIAGPAGAPEVKILIVNARKGSARPGILYTHGGGYVVGKMDSNVVDLQNLAKELDCVIVSVDYRLAPETSYLGSVEDNYTGLSWMYGHPLELGLDPARIAVVGDSAGGGHAALLAITARDRGQIPLVLQVLIYPMLDDRTGSSQPAASPVGRILWTAEANRFGWASFLGQPPGTDEVPVAAVPARIENLAGLPPAFIGVGSIDLFVDEDINYARRLIDVGVPTELLVVPGGFHAFDVIAADSDQAKFFTAAKINALKRAFGMVRGD